MCGSILIELMRKPSLEMLGDVSKVTSSESGKFHFVQIWLSPPQRALPSCLRHFPYLHYSLLLCPTLLPSEITVLCVYCLSLSLKGNLSWAAAMSYLLLYPQNLKETKLIFKACLYLWFSIIAHHIWITLHFMKCFCCRLIWLTLWLLLQGLVFASPSSFFCITSLGRLALIS